MLYTETERLILRPYEPEDYLQWLAGFANRKPSQYTYDEGKPASLETNTELWFTEWIRGFEESARQDKMYIFGVFRKSDGANVGKVELIPILRMDYDWAMMGYSIHNQFWKNGYGLESVQAAVELFFQELNFQRIELHINTDNVPSRRLAERAGFTYECTREAFSKEGDQWVDFAIYYQINPR